VSIHKQIRALQTGQLIEYEPTRKYGCWHPVRVYVGQALGPALVDCRLQPHWKTPDGKRWCTTHAKKLGFIGQRTHDPGRGIEYIK
jgi:hypothetical protein